MPQIFLGDMREEHLARAREILNDVLNEELLPSFIYAWVAQYGETSTRELLEEAIDMVGRHAPFNQPPLPDNNPEVRRADPPEA